MKAFILLLFLSTPLLAQPQIIKQSDSNRAVAVEAVFHTTEPFPQVSSWARDSRTRILLFATDVDEGVILLADDASSIRFEPVVEDVRPVPGMEWLEQLTVRLPEVTPGELILRLYYQNQVSDPAIITMGARPQISVKQPSPYQIFQRRADGKSEIPIKGTITGEPTGIYGRWNGGPWVQLEVTNGEFTGVLQDQEQGQGTLQVRGGNETISVPYVGIGDVFLVAGQSNAEGRISEFQSYQHPTLKAGVFDEELTWRELTDPSDSSWPRSGSVWPLLATEMMRDQNIPVAFITTAAPQSGLTNHGGSGWDPVPPTGPGPCLLSSLKIVRASGVSALKAVLWYQGENDAIASGMSTPFYESRLRALQQYMSDDLGYSVRLMVWQLAALQGYGENRTSLDAVRQAQANVWGDPKFLPGPVLYDLDIISDGDRVHIKKPEHARAEAHRAWSLMKSYLYGGTSSRGPVFNSARMVGLDKVEINFVTNSALTSSVPTQGWRVVDSVGLIGVTEAVRSGESTILLTLERPTSGSVTLSWASYNDAVGVKLWDGNDMPAEPFQEISVAPN